MAIMTVLLAIVVSAVGKIGADEAKAWLPPLARRILRLASSLLPKDQRGRCSEEWAADLSSCPGDVAKVIRAIGFCIAALRIASISREYRTSEDVAREILAKQMEEQIRSLRAEIKTFQKALDKAACDLSSAVNIPVSTFEWRVNEGRVSRRKNRLREFEQKLAEISKSAPDEEERSND